MVLADTSIWVRYFYDQAPHASELERLLDVEDIAGHELVYGELLIGDRGGRRKFLAAYERMHQARMVPHNDVVALTLFRKLHGRGVGWIDVHLLASAMAEHLQLWTIDAHLSEIAKELGVAYKCIGPSPSPRLK